MLGDYIVAKARTGSREICNPAPTDTDEDYIVLVEDINDQDLDRALRVEGFYFASGDGYPESEFHSYRKGDLNYILTDNAEFFDRFVAATQLARKYNLLEKSDRIQMFHAILEGEFISDEESQSRAGKKAKANSRVQGQTFTYIDELTDVPENSITIPWPETFIETVAYANSVTANNYRHNLTSRQDLEQSAALADRMRQLCNIDSSTYENLANENRTAYPPVNLNEIYARSRQGNPPF